LRRLCQLLLFSRKYLSIAESLPPSSPRPSYFFPLVFVFLIDGLGPDFFLRSPLSPTIPLHPILRLLCVAKYFHFLPDDPQSFFHRISITHEERRPGCSFVSLSPFPLFPPNNTDTGTISFQIGTSFAGSCQNTSSNPSCIETCINSSCFTVTFRRGMIPFPRKWLSLVSPKSLLSLFSRSILESLRYIDSRSLLSFQLDTTRTFAKDSPFFYRSCLFPGSPFPSPRVDSQFPPTDITVHSCLFFLSVPTHQS